MNQIALALATLPFAVACLSDDLAEVEQEVGAAAAAPAACTITDGTLVLQKLDILGAAMKQWVASHCGPGETTADATVRCSFLGALANLVASPLALVEPLYTPPADDQYRRILGGSVAYYNAAGDRLVTETIGASEAPTDWRYRCLVDCSATVQSSTFTGAQVLGDDPTDVPTGFCAHLQTQVVAKDVDCTLPIQNTWTAPITILRHPVPSTLTAARQTSTSESAAIPPHIAANHPTAVKSITTYDYETWTIDTAAMQTKCDTQLGILNPMGARDRCGQFAPNNAFHVNVAAATCVAAAPAPIATTTFE
jgi:hypothetical protein